MTRRIATPPLEWFPIWLQPKLFHLLSASVCLNCLHTCLKRSYMYMYLREKHLDNQIHVYSHLEAGFFLFFSQSLSQFISFLILLLSPCWPIICFTARGWYLSTHNRFASPANTQKITFTVKILCRLKK